MNELEFQKILRPIRFVGWLNIGLGIVCLLEIILSQYLGEVKSLSVFYLGTVWGFLLGILLLNAKVVRNGNY